MPFIVPIAIGVGVVASAVVGWLLYDHWWKTPGKVGVVGRQKSGKTTWVTFVRTGHLPPNPVSTTRAEESRIKIHGKEVLVVDAPGDPSHLEIWDELFRSCAQLVYMFDVSLLASGDRALLQALEADVGHFKRWWETGKKRPKVILVGTHTDKLLPDSTWLDSTKVAARPPVSTLLDILNGSNSDLVLGSLASGGDARRLDTEISRWFRDKVA